MSFFVAFLFTFLLRLLRFYVEKIISTPENGAPPMPSSVYVLTLINDSIFKLMRPMGSAVLLKKAC